MVALLILGLTFTSQDTLPTPPVQLQWPRLSDPEAYRQLMRAYNNPAAQYGIYVIITRKG